MIELAIILPVLLLLCFGSAELCHAILFNNILISMSREGANLASRTPQSPQFIIDALSNTSAPLQMSTQGMIYISRVKGVDAGSGSVIAMVDEQYRAVRGNAALMSRLWSCPEWDVAGKCTMPTAVATRVVTLPFTLGIGYEVQVVEVIYDYAPLTNLFLTTAPQLYSVTLF
ncbi:MAG: TadE/TadG family type IV pilus assembly protein [Polaromonas sp.]|nr:TadE/TadG family type IV pilus assembly protein [Polaromonas sp.]